MFAKRLLFLFSISLCCVILYGQDKATVGDSIDFKRPYKALQFPRKSNYFLVAPAFQTGNQSAKLGFMYLSSKVYRHGFTSKIFSVDFGGHLNNNIYTSSLGYSLASYFFIFGGRAGIKGVSYWRPEEQYAFALRPEVELIVAYFGISYGYDIFLDKSNELPLQGHNVTFSVYIPLSR